MTGERVADSVGLPVTALDHREPLNRERGPGTIPHEMLEGLIDELSLYDFALTADEVAEHSRRLLAGKPAIPATAFVRTVAGDRPLHWQGITRLVEGQTRVFHQHSGLSVD